MIHVMLPSQYLRRPADRVAEPYRRLMAAVLQTVVDDVRGTACRRSTGFGPATGKQARRATAYAQSADRVWPFSFENLCDILGVDADGLRRELQMREDPT
jgi:hypothetical protein